VARRAAPAWIKHAWLAALLLLLAPVGTAAAGGGDGGGGIGPGFDLDEASWTVRTAFVDVTLNGESAAEPAMLLKGPGGAVYATPAQLAAWRLRRPAAARTLTHEGETWIRIDTIPGLSIAFSAAAQSAAITAAPALFERARSGLAAYDAGPMTPSARGGFVNYDLFAELVRGEASVSGAAEVGAFTRHGVGVAAFAGRAGSGRDRLTRLETNWTIDRPASMTSLRIGDAIALGGPGAPPFRFGGVQFGRNFAVQPGFITMPLPALEGSAAVPSVVDVYVNNALAGSREVRPGPFELTNIPVQTGGGTVQLVVRDLLGRQMVSEYSYYASSRLLAKGLHDFSWEAGFERRNFGTRSNDYGPALAATSHRYGLTDRLTVEGHLQAGMRRQLASAGFVYSLFDLGLVGGSAAVSRTPRGAGVRLALDYERRGARLGFGGRAEYASTHFSAIGLPDGQPPPRLDLHAFIDAPLLGGTVGANIVHRDHRLRPDETIAGAFATFRVARAASAQLFVRHAVAGRSETVAGASLSLALGGRAGASAYGEYRSRGRSSAFLSVQSDPPVGEGTGWRLAASAGAAETVEAYVHHNLRVASLGAHATAGDTGTGVRVSAAGSLGLVGGRAFAARRLGTAFAAVKVGDHEGVRVYADNRLVGRTGADGMLIVPELRAWDRNMIRIEEADLPLDVRLAAIEQPVRPYARSGALVHFEAERERGALLKVYLEDGRLLPAGAQVRIDGGAEAHAVASGGEVYLPGLSGRHRIDVRWEGGRCGFTVMMPATQDPQPRIVGLICRSEVYAGL
jgi:outer membrane usher protein